MKNKIKQNARRWLYEASIIGVPLGGVGFLLDEGWVRTGLFIVGGLICGVGFCLGIVYRAEDKGRKSDEM